MTARQRRIYWNRERNKAVKYINKYQKSFYNALQSDMRGFQDALRESEQAARKYINGLLFSDGISRVMSQIIREVGVRYARTNYNTLRKEKQFNTSDEWIQLIMDYLGTNFYNNGVLQIVKTSRTMMLDILERGNREGWGYSDYAQYISQTVPGLNRNRADMIARTEVGRAIHAGTFVGADKSPFEKQKMWVAAKDNRTRGNPINGQKDKADHWHLDGQTVDFNDKFVDRKSGTELEHPHDPQAGAADVIRCRCTFAIVNKRDANGRLIRKTSGMVMPINRPLRMPPPPPPQEIRPSFTPARNIKEAEEWAKNNLKIKVDSYSGYSLDVANTINKTIFELQSKFKTFPQNVKLNSKVEGNAYAQFDWLKNELLIRKNYKSLEERIKKDNKTWMEKYKTDQPYMISENLEGTIMHEMGHALDKFTNREIYNQINNLSIEIKNKAFSISGYAGSDRFYGMHKGSEMIAEIVNAKLANDKRYNDLPFEVKLIFDKYFN